MQLYRTLWLATATAFTALGVVAAVMAVNPGSDLAVFVLSLAVAGTVQYSRNLEAGNMSGRSWWPLASTASRWGLVAVASCGYAVLIRTATLALIALAVSTCPWTIRRVTQRDDAVPQERARTADCGPVQQTGPGRLDLAKLDDRELCLAWRHSYIALQQADSILRRARIVELRRHCLDELERRNPQRFGEWLDSGPRAAGNPARYLLTNPPPPHPDEP